MDNKDIDIVDFESICRFCMNPKRTLISIFAIVGDNTPDIPFKVKDCTSIEVSQDDGMPAKICMKCLIALNSAYDFKNQCQTSDVILKGILNAANGSVHGEILCTETSEISAKAESTEDEEETDCFTDLRPGHLYLETPEENVQEIMNDESVQTTKTKVISEQRMDDFDDEEEEKVTCQYCGKVLRRLDAHIRLFHRNKIFFCPKPNCGKAFKTMRNLQSHQLTCFNMKKEFKCKYCLKEFHRKSNWKAHEKRHWDNKLECLLCGKFYVDSTALRKHFLRHHESQQRLYSCSTCGKSFKSREGWKKHEDRVCKQTAELKTMFATDVPVTK